MKIRLSNIKTAVACSCLLLSFSACSDWLDYTPKDKQTYEQQFSTREGFHNSVNGVYNKISSTSLYGYNLSYGPLDWIGQLYNIPSANVSRYEYRNYTWTGEYTSSTFSSVWSQAYNTILNANLLIQAVDEQSGVLTEKDAKLIKGEMLAVRGFLHFDLLRLFGPVYYQNPTASSIPYNDGTDATRRESMPADKLINEKLLPDLNAAELLLKDVDPILTDGVLNSDGGDAGNWERYRQLRMNYYAVCLLKARVYLWMRDYDNALLEAQKITDDAKVKESLPFVDPTKLLANSVNPDRIFSTECIFGFYDSEMSTIFQDYFSGTLDNTSLLQPRKGYVEILFGGNSSDYRRQSQWTGSSSASGSEYDFVKYKSFTANETNPEFHATFFGLMRVSEAYYIASECELNKRDYAKACEYLNVILEKRGEGTINSTSSTTILNNIKFEYLREMRGEGQIYYMFKRFRQTFGEYDGGNSKFDGATAPSFDSVDNHYSVPIPSNESN